MGTGLSGRRAHAYGAGPGDPLPVIHQEPGSHPEPDSEPALKSLAVHEPGAEWSVDLAGPFPADKNGNTYIVVAVDSFSRFVMAKAVKSTKAEETARFILSY